MLPDALSYAATLLRVAIFSLFFFFFFSYAAALRYAAAADDVAFD